MTAQDVLIAIAIGAPVIGTLFIIFILYYTPPNRHFIECGNCDTLNDPDNVTALDKESGWFNCRCCGMTLQIKNSNPNTNN